MTKKEAILIANILQKITIKTDTEPRTITISKENINDTLEYLIMLNKITKRAYQKAKMTMSEDEIQYITRQFLRGKI